MTVCHEILQVTLFDRGRSGLRRTCLSCPICGPCTSRYAQGHHTCLPDLALRQTANARNPTQSFELYRLLALSHESCCPQVYYNGVQILTHEGFFPAGFDSYGAPASAVSTVMIESVGLNTSEWLSLLEVRFLLQSHCFSAFLLKSAPRCV